MAETIEVYGREFEVGKPKARHYISLLRLVKDLIKEGYGDAIAELTARARTKEGISDTQAIFLVLDLVDELEEQHLTRFAAILLQDDVDDTVAFIEENGGVEIGALMEAFAVNCEQADIGEVVAFFRRAQEAIGGWRDGS